MCVCMYLMKQMFIKDLPYVSTKYFKHCVPAFKAFTVYLTVGKKHSGGEQGAEGVGVTCIKVTPGISSYSNGRGTWNGKVEKKGWRWVCGAETGSSVSPPTNIPFWSRYRCWSLWGQVTQPWILATPDGGASFLLGLISSLGSAPQPLC